MATCSSFSFLPPKCTYDIVWDDAILYGEQNEGGSIGTEHIEGKPYPGIQLEVGQVDDPI